MILAGINLLLLLPLHLLEENMSAFNPVHIFFREFDYTDFFYRIDTARQRSIKADEIVIINGDCATPGKIARLINEIKKYDPAVIGLDYFFDDSTSSGEAEKKTEDLQKAITSCDKLVIGYRYQPENTVENDKANTLIPGTGLQKGANTCGFLNLSDSITTIRRAGVCIDCGENPRTNSFAMGVAEKYLGGGQINDTEQIIINYMPVENFRKLSSDTILRDMSALSLDTLSKDSILKNRYTNTFKDKIILIGEFDDGRNPCGIQDKHYTPYNEELAGRSFPDMNGIFIHANIIRNILGTRQITEVSDRLCLLITFLLSIPLLLLLNGAEKKFPYIFHLLLLPYELLVYLSIALISIKSYGAYKYINFKLPYEVALTLPVTVMLVAGVKHMIFHRAWEKTMEKYITKAAHLTKKYLYENKEKNADQKPHK